MKKPIRIACEIANRLGKIVTGGVLAMVLTAAQAAEPVKPLVDLRGDQFDGGAKDQFGRSYLGEDHVNYVYAKPTETAAVMRAAFELKEVPQMPLSLHLTGADDDFPSQCSISIELNGKSLYSGPSGFPDSNWQTRRFAIPAGTLKIGANEVVVKNSEPSGKLGSPPWFMVANCAVAAADYVPPAPKIKTISNLKIELPKEKLELPMPLAAGEKPGFKLRGIKGWNWSAEQYLEEIPILAKYKMNFLMNCYLSMFTNGKNEWWQPIPDEKKEAYAKVIQSCKEHGIEFCFAVHPQLGSPRPMNPSSAEDFKKLWQHYEWAQAQGVHWFCLPLDDVAATVEQFVCANKLFARLRAKDSKSQLIFCPTEYIGLGGSPYLAAMATDLHPEIYCFWTGPQCVCTRITRAQAESYKNSVKHRLIIWDNYPVNDGSPTLHLGPITGRDPEPGEVCDGYMANPLCPQNQINRLPLLTEADYAYNPRAYDPQRSIGQAIVHLAAAPAQQQVLKDLVEAYPGMLILGTQSTGDNPVRRQFAGLIHNAEHRDAAIACEQKHIELADRLDKAFPDRFAAARRTVRGDAQWMLDQLSKK